MTTPVQTPDATSALPPTQTDANNQALLQVRGLKKYFPITQGILFQKKVADVKAVDGVSFDVYPGETLGLVG